MGAGSDPSLTSISHFDISNRVTRYHRRSIRLKGYDYSLPGAYFVTMVTNSHKCLFGKIIDKEMQINNLGKIVQNCWLEIPKHFSNVDADMFVVMPNHIYGIITIQEENSSRGTINRAPTTIEKYGNPVVGSIPTIIRTYKAAVSRRAKQELGMINFWQRNYYEHIIRNQLEFDDLAKYILANPDQWISDPEYIS